MQSFSDRLAAAIRNRRSPVMVGLDPRAQQLPAPFQAAAQSGDVAQIAAAYRDFCFGVIDVVAPLVPIVKPQMAFFETLGAHGVAALAEVVQYARAAGLLIVLDGKRNDIGSTATAYAEAYLGADSHSGLGADALTASPYLGDDSLEPFVVRAELHQAGLFVLVKTSNPGGKTFQDLIVAADGLPLYRHAAALVEGLAKQTRGECGYGDVGAVVGATYPEQLLELRREMPHSWFLVPGFGSQGGTAADVAPAFDERGLGAVINNSRGIIFAHERYDGIDWQQAVERAAREMIDQLRAETLAGNL